jgi:methylglyoxal/glyoxal reductase
MLYRELSNGFKLPMVMLGTFEAQIGGEIGRVISDAYRTGYRAIDTASIYENEEEIGNALKNQGIIDDVIITSKLWNDMHNYDDALKAFEESEKKLGRVDIYLIHWPTKEFIETWKAFERLYKDGRVKAIGVSNFLSHHLKELIKSSQIVPMVNQIETHVYFMDLDTINFCRRYNIVVEAWGPLMRTGDLLENTDIKKIGEGYGKSSAQVVLRYLIEKDIIVLPKSAHTARLQENISIFDFKLNEEEIHFLEALNIGKRVGPHPDEFNSLTI